MISGLAPKCYLLIDRENIKHPRRDILAFTPSENLNLQSSPGKCVK